MPFSTHSSALVRLLAPLVAVVALMFAADSAQAETIGQLRRFGPTAGSVEKAPGKGKLVAERTRLIGVDAAEENAVFVLEEPHEVKYGKSGGKEVAKRTFRVQKFNGKTGAFISESPILEAATSEEGPDFGENEVEGIAIDEAAKELYFLVDAGGFEGELYEPTPAAAYLFALKTTDLTPASGTTEGVLAGPKALGAEPRKAGETLLEPRGLTVDPKTHEVIVLAHTDPNTSEDNIADPAEHFVLQRITTAGTLGSKFVDSANFFKQTPVAGEEWKGIFSPSSPVTDGENIFVFLNGIAKLPADFSKAPTQLVSEPLATQTPDRLIEPIEFESWEEGVPEQMTLSPDGKIYTTVEVFNEAEREIAKQGGDRQAVVEHSAATGALIGWTGGQSPFVAEKSEDQCVIQPSTSEEPLPAIAAGKEGDLFVLAPQFLEEETLPTHNGIIEFGPGGKGCPTGSLGKVVVKVGEAEIPVGEPVVGSPTLHLSAPLRQLDALSATWVIENVNTKTKSETTVNQEQYGEAELSTKLAGGEFKITVKVHSDNLAMAETIESPARTLKVEAPIEECPTITQQPKDASGLTGGTAEFHASATGNPKPTVQWQVSTDNGATWTKDESDPGRTTETLKVEHLKVTQSGHEYRAMFKNSSCEQPTEAAKLTVTSEAPKVTKQPADITVGEGGTATFEAGATGGPAPTVQWEVSTNGGASYSPVGGATGTQLNVASVTVSMSGYKYRATFNNEAGSASSGAATLSVTPAPPPHEEPGGGVLPGQERKPASPAAVIASAGAVTKSGTLTLKVTCPTGASTCIGTVVVRTIKAVAASAHSAKAKKAILTLAQGSFSIAGGASKTVTLHLSAKAKKLLAQLHKLAVRATVSSHDPQGDRETTAKSLTLRAPKKH
jgi:Immunoglobulin I-set domain